MNSIFKYFGALWLVSTLLWFSIIAGILYVGWHFVGKFW